MTVAPVTFDNVLALARRLPIRDQARLIARLAPSLEQAIPTEMEQTRPRLRGLLAHLGPAPSAEEIDEVQREMSDSFEKHLETI